MKGVTLTEGVVLIDPAAFGAGGKVMKEIAADQIAPKRPGALAGTVKTFVPPVSTRRELAALGLKEGIFYETGIPVCGEGQAADRERYKQLLVKKK